jgi:alkylhydroperoxidase family enzyme
MGHSEMLLAVAGLKLDEIKKRTKKLADGDWSDYSAAEQIAFQFAHKLAKDPAALTNQEMKRLTETFGSHRAIDLIWYGAWCNYMTRVADAFQLPLEKENVFERPKKP